MSDSEKELFGEPEDGMEVSDAESQEFHEPVHHSALLKRYAPSHHSSNAWLSRMPAFLNLEPRPFDAAKFGAVEKSDDQLALEANTVRWKYAAAENEAEQKVTRVSNARIVDWSDGSRTLQLGDEHFEIKTHNQADSAFLCTEHEEDSLLATRHLINDTMYFLPTSTSSATHKMLAQALQRKQESGQIRVGSVNTTEDPDKAQREIERVEQAKDKARRKLAAQRDEIISYTDRSVTQSAANDMDVEDEEGEDEEEGEEEAGESEEEESEAQESNSEAEDQRDDDGDDDERANRLNQIKHQEEANENENKDEDENSNEAPSVQRRRVLDDEDSE